MSAKQMQGRINFLRSALAKSNGADPQEHLDDETVAKYTGELETLEYRIEDVWDAEMEMRRTRNEYEESKYGK